MKLYYYKDDKGNVGDDLNPYLWERLLPDLFTGYVNHNPRARTCAITDESLFVGIGTILNTNIPDTPLKAVFGSGCGLGPLPTINERWTFYCVRGPLTAEKLGLPRSVAVTDPAALLSTLGISTRRRTNRFAFMPHISSVRVCEWSRICQDMEIVYIDPQWPVDEVLGHVLSAETLITEAMHGAIIADSLRVPWIAVTSSSEILEFKWIDWCSSLNMRLEMHPIPRLWIRAPHNSPWRKMTNSAKYRMTTRAFRRLMHQTIPQISEERRLVDSVEMLLERLEAFQKDYRNGRFEAS